VSNVAALKTFLAVTAIVIVTALPAVSGAATGSKPDISLSLTYPGAGPGGSTATWLFGPWIVSTQQLTVTMKHSPKLTFVSSSRRPAARSATALVWRYTYPRMTTGLCCSKKGLTIRVRIPAAAKGTRLSWSITAVAKNATGTTTRVKSSTFKVTG
jgi:hypothetical protein